MKLDHDTRENWREAPLEDKKFAIQLTSGHIATTLVIFGLVVTILFYLYIYNAALNFKQFSSDFYANCAVEALSIAFTVLVIDKLNKRLAEAEEKKWLIFQMGSPDNSFAKQAARRLAAQNWLYDGSLKQASLVESNLDGAKLEGADLSEVDFASASLQTAILRKASLRGAFLGETNFSNADLWGAKMQDAILQMTDFTEAILLGANLTGAELFDVNFYRANMRYAKLDGTTIKFNTSFLGANLERASFEGAMLSETVILPDGSFINPDGDYHEQLRRFTDEKHPNFWKSPIQ